MGRDVLPNTLEAKKLIHRYIGSALGRTAASVTSIPCGDDDVYEYPDGRIELRADGLSLAYVRYDKLPVIEAGAIVENKRLSHALRVAQLIQPQRDDRRSGSRPFRTNSGAEPQPRKAETGKRRPTNSQWKICTLRPGRVRREVDRPLLPSSEPHLGTPGDRGSLYTNVDAGSTVRL